MGGAEANQAESIVGQDGQEELEMLRHRIAELEAAQAASQQSAEYRPTNEILWNGESTAQPEALQLPQCSPDSVFFGDTSERKQAEEMLLQEHHLFMKGPVIVFKWTAEETWPVEYVSANITQLGYQVEDLLSGQVPYAALIFPEDQDRVAAEVSEYSAADLPSPEPTSLIFRIHAVLLPRSRKSRREATQPNFFSFARMEAVFQLRSLPQISLTRTDKRRPLLLSGMLRSGRKRKKPYVRQKRLLRLRARQSPSSWPI